MEIKCKQRELAAVVAQAERFADPKNPREVASKILLEAKASGLTLSATDLYLGIRATCPCETVKEGAVVVSARDLLERVTHMPSEREIAISLDRAKVVLRSVGGTRRYSLMTVAAGDFPSLPSPSGNPEGVVTSLVLRRLFDKTVFAVTADGRQIPQANLKIEFNGTAIRGVALDGHRLVKIDLVDEASSMGTLDLLLPLRGVRELMRILPDDDTLLTLSSNGRHLFVDTGNCRVHVLLAEGMFPAYEHAIHEDNPRVATVPRLELLDAIKAVSVSASILDGAVSLEFSLGTVKVRAESQIGDEADDEIPAKYDGEDCATRACAKYFLDSLSTTDTEEVVFRLGEPKDGIFLAPGGESRDAHVIMPMYREGVPNA